MTAQEILEQSIGKLFMQNCGLQGKVAELEAKVKAGQVPPDSPAPEPITNKYHD